LSGSKLLPSALSDRRTNIERYSVQPELAANKPKFLCILRRAAHHQGWCDGCQGVALQAPARQIAENAGEDGAVVSGKILDSKEYAFGYNAQSGEYGDLVKQGVIDPAKVVRTALQDASSVAGLLITTEAMVAEKPKPKAPAMPPGGGMGGMGDMDY
jgi:TCP-1/cpn60 chaperonin family